MKWVLLLFFLAVVAMVSSTKGLEWRAARGYRSAELTVSGAAASGFTAMPPQQTGIYFTNWLSQQRHLTNQLLLNGSGVAAGDVDGDGWCDLYFCGLDGLNGLYRNTGGWKFENITTVAGVACEGLDATAAALPDFDGDGDLDLIVNSCSGGTHIFINDGRARFRRATPPNGLNARRGGTSMALGDMDGDGYLDVYITNYRMSALMDMPETHFSFKAANGQQTVARVNGRSVTEPDLVGRFWVNSRGGIEENGEVDVLYRNIGGTNVFSLGFTNGLFLDEDGSPLRAPPADWGLAVMFRDLNGDGLPDLYVCNDFDSPDRIWMNQEGLRFRAAPRLVQRKASHFSMGVDFADINRDGWDDFVVLDMLSRDRVVRMDTQGLRNPPVITPGDLDTRPDYMMNTLFLNRGDGTYAEIAQLSGIAASDWSWTPVFLDVDLDGWEDLLISNGHERTARSMDMAERLKTLRLQKKLSPTEILQARHTYPRYDTPNVTYRNRRDLTFEEKNWGLGAATVSHGMALADLDNDGDLDLAVNNLNEVAGIYRNETTAPRLAIYLKGNAPNTRGVGARITVEGGPVAQSQEMGCGGRYLSADAPERVFAAGTLTNELTVQVRWRSGKISTLAGLRPNHVYEIAEGASEEKKPGVLPAPEPWFADVSPLLAHRHEEDPFDDFALQPALPKKYSQLGPGVAWIDLDQDGWEDLFIGGGKGGRAAAFRNTARGGFERWPSNSWNRALTEDQTGVVGLEVDGQISILSGMAAYETSRTNTPMVSQYRLRADAITGIMTRGAPSVGPIAVADYDLDGDLDLFVGGRVARGRYPMPTSSFLFRNENGTWVLDAANTKRLVDIGLVSGAVWTDLDADGDPELVMACEWGPLRVFRNDEGQLADLTSAWGLTNYVGWWNGVSAGDFDGDGRMDLLASNWGRNTPYEEFRERPLRLLAGDVDDDGVVEIFESVYESKSQQWVAQQQLDFQARSMPFLRAQFTSHQSYARSGVSQILGPHAARMKPLEATWLETTLFLNHTSRFVARSLPTIAQVAPAFAVCINDFDGDGAEDVFLSQNFFATQPGFPRYDGGVGLWLRGDGAGGLIPVSVLESGLRGYGEQRGAAAADFDHDGRVDLVFTQNGADTKLFKNRRSPPGIAVELRGLRSNRTGVGAVLRLGDVNTFGPAREVHAGSGYWSQDSARQILFFNGEASRVWVRWPGGVESTATIPAGSRTVVVTHPGAKG